MIVPGGPRIDSAAKLAALLREQITSGKLTPGALLPSERILGQTYGLARGTVGPVSDAGGLRLPVRCLADGLITCCPRSSRFSS